VIIDYSIAIFSEWKERVLRIARDALAVPGEGDGDAYPMVQPLGILSRPNDPELDEQGQPKTGAGLLTLEDGHEGFAIPTTDPRILELIPELPKGSTVVYACNGGFVFLNGETGTIQILCPYKDGEESKSHHFTFDVPNASIQLGHGKGMGFSITAGGKDSFVLRNKDGKVYIELNNEEIVANAPKVTINASQVVGDAPSAQNVLIAQEFAAYKAANDANWATLAGASGSMVPPGLSPTAAIQVVGSTALKASPAP
jgi:hypothetical protein